MIGSTEHSYHHLLALAEDPEDDAVLTWTILLTFTDLSTLQRFPPKGLKSKL